MAQSKNTKRALLASILSIVLCCAMLIGSTFAWFTDSVETGKNTITAGNLDVDLQYAEVAEGTDLTTLGDDAWTSVQGKEDLFSEDLWEPGHVEVVYLRIQNLGTWRWTTIYGFMLLKRRWAPTRMASRSSCLII